MNVAGKGNGFVWPCDKKHLYIYIYIYLFIKVPIFRFLIYIYIILYIYTAILAPHIPVDQFDFFFIYMPQRFVAQWDGPGLTPCQVVDG